MKNLILLFFSALAWGCCETPKHEISLRPSEYVTTLVGTQSDYSLSTGNTYPAVALPWGMNFWTPQTGKMGDGWAYTYGSHTIRGLKQTHQPSPWINDYGRFSIMPVRGKDKVDENARQSWFSHQSERRSPIITRSIWPTTMSWPRNGSDGSRRRAALPPFPSRTNRAW